MPRSYQPLLWAGLADEARAAAKQINDPDLKLRVLLVAGRYLAWAKQAERNETAAPHRRSRQLGFPPRAVPPDDD
jgi:hypothetical protein